MTQSDKVLMALRLIAKSEMISQLKSCGISSGAIAHAMSEIISISENNPRVKFLAGEYKKVMLGDNMRNIKQIAEPIRIVSAAIVAERLAKKAIEDEDSEALQVAIAMANMALSGATWNKDTLRSDINKNMIEALVGYGASTTGISAKKFKRYVKRMSYGR